MTRQIESWLTTQAQVGEDAAGFISLKRWREEDVLAYRKVLNRQKPAFASLYFACVNNEMINICRVDSQTGLYGPNVDRYPGIRPDQCGAWQGAGDEYLIAFAEFLRDMFSQKAIVARSGGAEFILMFGDADGLSQAMHGFETIESVCI